MDCLLHSLPQIDAIKDEPDRRQEPGAWSLEPGVIVADVTLRYGMHRNQLYNWRSSFGVQPAKSRQSGLGLGQLDPGPAAVIHQ